LASPAGVIRIGKTGCIRETAATSWRQFFFTAKVTGRFTHEGSRDADDLARFRAGLRPLEEAGRLHALLAERHHRLKPVAEA